MSTTTLTREPPKLRSDLRISEQKSNGDSVFILKDPVTGRFFRFKEAELFISKQMDGATPLNIIGQRTGERFGDTISVDELQVFVDQLRGMGLLEPATGSPARRTSEPRRVRGDMFYLRWKAFDPDRFLTWLLPKLRFCFTPWFLAGCAALFVGAVGLALANGAEIQRDAIRLYRFETLIMVWWTILGVTTLHEFSHGLTCKRFGGEVHELGFMLIYFQPALYCNVSDSWLFPRKSHRLWVTFAGVFFDLSLWAVAVVIWRLTEPGNWVNSTALVVVGTSIVRSAFNLNPLIKLDGYYLLADLVDVPNLRARAFKYFRSLVARPIHGADGAVARAASDSTPRERRICFWYGLLAGSFSLWLFGSIAWWAGRYFVGKYQGMGFLIFAALLLLVFRRRIKWALARASSWMKSKTAKPKPESRASSGRAPFRFGVRRLAVLAILAGIIAFLVFGRLELKVPGEFTLLPVRRAEIRADVEGMIEKLYVDEGDEIEAGAPIARIADREYAAELAKTEAAIEEKCAKLRMLNAGPRQEEIDLAQQVLDAARQKHTLAAKRFEEAKSLRKERLAKAEADVGKAVLCHEYGRNELERAKRLFEAGLSSREELEASVQRTSVLEKDADSARSGRRLVQADDLAEVQQELAEAEGESAEAKAKLALLLAGSRPEEIEAVEAEIARLDTERLLFRERLAHVNLTSPFAGVVTTPKIKEKIGQYAKQGDLIAEVHELKRVVAEISVPENELGDVCVGQAVALKIRSFPERMFSGKVEAISPAAARDDTRFGQRFFRVTTVIDNSHQLLRPEMTGAAKIYCGERPAYEIVTRRLARYLRVEFWSWW